MAEIYKGKIMFAVGERIECKTHAAVCTPHGSEANTVCQDCIFCNLRSCKVFACMDYDRRDGLNVYFPYVRKEVEI